MVGDVAQVALQLLVGAVLVEPGHQPLEHAEQGAGGPLELDHLAGQLVDAPGDPRVAPEDLGLDLVDVVLQPGDHGGVPVHHAVQDRVQHRLGAQAQQLGVVLHAAAHRGQVGRLAVPDGQHEVRADEHVDLAELDLLDVVEVAGGAQHHEQGVAVAFQLGPLVGDDGVLHRHLVQPELLRDGQELGLGRPVQPDPGHRARLLPQPPRGLRHRGRVLHAPAFAVDGGGDDALLDGRGDRGGPRLHRHLGRRRAPPVVGGARGTPVGRQDAGTPVGHGNLQTRTGVSTPEIAPASVGTRRLAATHGGLTSLSSTSRRTRHGTGRGRSGHLSRLGQATAALDAAASEPAACPDRACPWPWQVGGRTLKRRPLDQFRR